MNLEDIAELAGVSRSTVSRVVNGDKRVSDATRRRVQEIIHKHDFQPNAAARSLASRRTRILGLLVPQAMNQIFGDPFFPKLVQGALEVCNLADYNLMMLMDTSEDPASSEKMYRRVIRGRHLDGLVIASSLVSDPMVSKLHRDRYPFLLVGRHPKYENINFVDIDNKAAAESAVSHLLDHGYRRIGMIGGPTNMIAAIDRYGGYVSAMLQAGIIPNPNLTQHSDFTNAGGYTAMLSLMAHEPEAVFVASDMMALGALRALHESGRSVPEDVAIMSFDGLPDSAISHPPLSTVEQDVVSLGRESVRSLLKVVESPSSQPLQGILPARMLLRRSCGCTEPSVPECADGANKQNLQPGIEVTSVDRPVLETGR